MTSPEMQRSSEIGRAVRKLAVQSRIGRELAEEIVKVDPRKDWHRIIKRDIHRWRRISRRVLRAAK